MEGDNGWVGCPILVYGISIHTLRMEGDAGIGRFAHLFTISIHTLRMEGDDKHVGDLDGMTQFQSTPSAWRVTSSAPFALF